MDDKYIHEITPAQAAKMSPDYVSALVNHLKYGNAEKDLQIAELKVAVNYWRDQLHYLSTVGFDNDD